MFLAAGNGVMMYVNGANLFLRLFATVSDFGMEMRQLFAGGDEAASIELCVRNC